MKISSVRLFIAAMISMIVLPSLFLPLKCSAQKKANSDLTEDLPTAQDPHPRISPMKNKMLMVTVLSTGPKATSKDALSRGILIVDKSSLEQVPATTSLPQGITILQPWWNSFPNNQKIVTDNSSDFTLKLFFGNDGSSKMLPFIHGTPLDNHIHIIPRILNHSSIQASDVTLFLPNPATGQISPICKGSYISDFLQKVDAVPANTDTRAKPWGIRVQEFYRLPWQQHEGTVYISLTVPTVYRDDGTVEQEPALLECTEMKSTVITIKGKGGKEEQQTKFTNGPFILRPITENKTQILNLDRGQVALLLRDKSPSAKGPLVVGVYDSRQLEKNATSDTISISEFYLMSDGQVLKITRIFLENRKLYYNAAIEGHSLDNRAQELPLAGGKTAVFEEDMQPGAKGPHLKEIRETYLATPFSLELLGK